MMTAKEYVEGKVKSYTRLAERCRREAESSDDIVVRAGYSARTSQKGDDFRRPSPQKYHNMRQTARR